MSTLTQCCLPTGRRAATCHDVRKECYSEVGGKRQLLVRVPLAGPARKALLFPQVLPCLNQVQDPWLGLLEGIPGPHKELGPTFPERPLDVAAAP